MARFQGRWAVFYPDDETAKRFDGFGPSSLTDGREPPTEEVVLAESDRASRKLVRRLCPRSPGVYGMIDADDRLIYVGKSKSLRDRLASYFGGRSADPKARHIIAHSQRIVFEPGPHEFTAFLRELELIRRWCPRFNVRGRPGRVRRGYIAIGRGPAAFAEVIERPSSKRRILVGPLRPTRELRRLIRVVNDHFQLRDCPEETPIAFSDQLQLFPEIHPPRCIRRDLGNCLGPCAGQCSSRQYARRVRAARDFLAGAIGPLHLLEREMLDASAACQFERAAALRDRRQDLLDLAEQLARLREVQRDYAFVYPLPSYDGRHETWHIIRRGQVAAVATAPRNRTAARQALRLLERVFPAEPPVLEDAEDPDLVHIVSTWFRANPGELDRVLSPDAAKEHCAAALAPAVA